MQAVIDSIPKTGQVRVDISVSAVMNISAYAARQKVNAFVLGDISYMLHAGEPALVVGENLVWRVPVILSLRSRGDIGQVGALDVSVDTGQLHVTQQIIQEINAHAETLALGAASSTAG
jgi:hypothetical protein